MTITKGGMAVDLSASAHYVTPTGRWCRWVPAGQGSAQRKSIGEHLFLYHGARGQPAANRPASEGFFLTDANLGILTRIAG
jgi:hypothetical protein